MFLRFTLGSRRIDQTSQTPANIIQLKDISDIQRVDLKPFCLEVEANGKVSPQNGLLSDMN